MCHDPLSHSLRIRPARISGDGDLPDHREVVMKTSKEAKAAANSRAALHHRARKRIVKGRVVVRNNAGQRNGK